MCHFGPVTPNEEEGVSQQLLTVTEVAERCRIHPSTVRAMIERGDLPGVRIGKLYRIPQEAVERLVRVPESEPVPA